MSTIITESPDGGNTSINWNVFYTRDRYLNAIKTIWWSNHLKNMTSKLKVSQLLSEIEEHFFRLSHGLT